MSIYVFSGEDTQKVDTDSLALKKQFDTVRTFEELPELHILKSELLTQSLFVEKKLFVFRNIFLFQVNRGKFTKKIEDVMQLVISTQPSVAIVFVDDDSNKTKYYKSFFPKAEFHESKLPGYLFTYLDNLKPGNFLTCYKYVQQAIKAGAAEIVFFMTRRRIRELLMLSTGTLKGNYQPWQLGKLKSQAHSWTPEKLTSFYESMYRIERSLKTGITPYNLQQSLEITLGLFL